MSHFILRVQVDRHRHHMDTCRHACYNIDITSKGAVSHQHTFDNWRSCQATKCVSENIAKMG